MHRVCKETDTTTTSMLRFASRYEMYHVVLFLGFALYPFSCRSRAKDAAYLTLALVVFTHWTLFEKECLLTYLEKVSIDKSYDLGTCPNVRPCEYASPLVPYIRIMVLLAVLYTIATTESCGVHRKGVYITVILGCLIFGCLLKTSEHCIAQIWHHKCVVAHEIPRPDAK